MIRKLKEAISAPVFKGDEEKTHAAGHLNAVLLGLGVGAVFNGLAEVVFERGTSGRFFLLLAFLILVLLAATLMSRGRIRFASLLIVVGAYAFFTLAAALNGGLRSPAYGGLVAVVLISGLLKGIRAGFLFAFLSLITGLAILIANATGILPSSSVNLLPSQFLISQTAFTLGTTVTLVLVIRNIRARYRRAHMVIDSQRQVEISLRESESRIHDIFDGLRDSILVENMYGDILYANSQACEMYGRSREEMLKSTVLSLVPDGPEAIFLSEYPDGEIPDTPFETVNVRADGERFPVEISARLQQLAGETVMLLVVRDITKRKNAVDTLRRSSEIEHLIATISTRFLSINLNEFDVEVTSALRDIAENFNLMRCDLVQLSSDRPSYSLTHEWYAEGDPSTQNDTQNMLPSQFPWASKRLLKGEVLHIPHVQELPIEAKAAKEFLLDRGVNALLQVPLLSGKDLIGFLSMSYDRDQVTIAEQEIPLLKLIGEIFTSTLIRNNAEEALLKSSALERLIATTSRRFLSSSHMDFDGEIENSLGEIGTNFRLIRCSLAQQSQDSQTYSITHEWYDEGVPPIKDLRQDVRPSEFPWVAAKLFAGEVVHVPEAEKLPSEAAALSDVLRNPDDHSILMVPITSEGALIGLISLSYNITQTSIPEDAIPPLKIIGEIFASALIRMDAEESLRDSTSLEHLVATTSRRFLTANQKYFDVEIKDSLKDVGEFFRFGQCNLWERKNGTPSYILANEWSAPGIRPLEIGQKELHADEFAWATEMIFAGETFHVRDVDELPQEALILKECSQAQELRALLALPFISDGELVGVLSFHYAREKSILSGQAIPLIKIIGEILKNAINRKQAMEALREGEATLRAFVNAIPEPSLLIDADHKLVALNGALAERLDRPIEELMYKNAFSFLPPKLADERKVQIEKVFRSGESVQFEDSQAGRDYFNYVNPIFDEGGAVSRVAIFALDTTDFKRAEAALLETNRRLEDALANLKSAQEQALTQARMAAVGQLAAGIAHDFNNILTPITIYSQMLLGESDFSPKGKERLEIILQQARRASSLTDQLLDFSRRGVMEPQRLDMVEFLNEFVRLLKRTLPESIMIEIAHSNGEHNLHADPTRMQQVFMNLALNSRDAMKEGGRLYLEVSRERIFTGETPSRPGLAPGDWIRISFSDTGAGIKPAHVSHIFEPFFTTKDPGAGTGLGLAQVYGIIKQHNGNIYVESEKDMGTKFHIYLPAYSGDDEAETIPDEEVHHVGSQQTILLVEDNEATRRALLEILDELNYRVIGASDGLEALEVYDREEIDLVISDLVMPQMGGDELFTALHEKNANLKMVILTGYPLEEEVRKLTDESGLHWVQKPLGINKISSTLKLALEG